VKISSRRTMEERSVNKKRANAPWPIPCRDLLGKCAVIPLHNTVVESLIGRYYGQLNPVWGYLIAQMVDGARAILLLPTRSPLEIHLSTRIIRKSFLVVPIRTRIVSSYSHSNSLYRHVGCKCPSDFYGPHCEYLLLNTMEDETAANTKSNSSSNGSNMFSAAVVIVTVSLILVFVMAVVHTRRRRSQQKVIVPFVAWHSDSGNISPLADEEGRGSRKLPFYSDTLHVHDNPLT
jgi:hypothetical protein